jgi:predicted ATPase
VLHYVSNYALHQKDQHAHEFMAEVHAKLMAGQTVPASVVSLN